MESMITEARSGAQSIGVGCAAVREAAMRILVFILRTMGKG